MKYILPCALSDVAGFILLDALRVDGQSGSRRPSIRHRADRYCLRRCDCCGVDCERATRLSRRDPNAAHRRIRYRRIAAR